jgi:hemin uptake protein HemP
MRIIRIMCLPEMKLVTQASPKSGATPGPATRPGVLDSVALLGSRNEVEITHQGETYRLRRTRQDKLILTK